MLKKPKLLGLHNNYMINECFDCKDLDWVPMDGIPIGYSFLACSIAHACMPMDYERTFLVDEMCVHVNNALEIMEWSHLKPAARPLRGSINIDGESLELSPE